MLAAVAVVKKITPELVILSLPKLVSTTNIDILYKTTPNTAATAKATNSMTMVKLKTVAGNFILQNGGCGSLEFVTKSIRIFFTFCRRAERKKPMRLLHFISDHIGFTLPKYLGRGCSSCRSNPVKSQRCVISAEYRFHSSRKRVARKPMLLKVANNSHKSSSYPKKT